jgi:AcrR family transcriptional regulator
MDELFGSIRIKIPSPVYLKDPETSELGRQIVRMGLEKLHDIGYEQFTFKKLAECIGSPESSVYRYFENKHRLLVYLLNWYWSWQEYRVTFGISNVSDAKAQLERAIEILNTLPDSDEIHDGLSLQMLFRLAEQESSRVFLHHETPGVERAVFFEGYRRLCSRLTKLVTQIRPEYPYPKALVTTVLDAIHLQPLYARELQHITDLEQDSSLQNTFFTRLILSNLNYG